MDRKVILHQQTVCLIFWMFVARFHHCETNLPQTLTQWKNQVNCKTKYNSYYNFTSWLTTTNFLGCSVQFFTHHRFCLPRPLRRQGSLLLQVACPLPLLFSHLWGQYPSCCYFSQCRCPPCWNSQRCKLVFLKDLSSVTLVLLFHSPNAVFFFLLLVSRSQCLLQWGKLL